jgi:hypothetical protein
MQRVGVGKCEEGFSQCIYWIGKISEDERKQCITIVKVRIDKNTIHVKYVNSHQSMYNSRHAT